MCGVLSVAAENKSLRASTLSPPEHAQVDETLKYWVHKSSDMRDNEHEFYQGGSSSNESEGQTDGQPNHDLILRCKRILDVLRLWRRSRGRRCRFRSGGIGHGGFDRGGEGCVT